MHFVLLDVLLVPSAALPLTMTCCRGRRASTAYLQLLLPPSRDPLYCLCVLLDVLPFRLSCTRRFPPASTTFEPAGTYLLLGLVLGLAVYNRVLLDFPLPLAAYKKVRGGCRVYAEGVDCLRFVALVSLLLSNERLGPCIDSPEHARMEI